MRPTLTRVGAFVCVLAFLANCAVIVGAAGPRNPGPDVSIDPNDIIFKVDDNPVQQAIIGTPVTINVTVRNAGTAPTQNVKVNITYDTVVVIALLQLPAPIPSSGFVYCETVWDTGASTNLLPGDHIVNVTVTDNTDDSLANNVAGVHFQILPVPKPFVYVDDIVLPDNALVGDTVKVTAKLKNKGNMDQTEVDYVKFYVGTQFLPDGQVLYQGSLPGDNVTSISVDYMWNTTLAGKFFIVVEVLSSGYKGESHIINISYPSPNVYVSRVDPDKAVMMQGESVNVAVKLRNNGSKAATDEEIWFLVDDATSPSSSNYTVYKSVPKGDTEVGLSFVWNSTDAAPGNHTFKVKVPNSADPNAIRTSTPVQVQPRVPKMAMTMFVVTLEEVDSGQPVVLSALLTNTGTADAYNQEVRFFLGSTETYPLALKKVNVKAGDSAYVNFTYTPTTGENDTRMDFFALFTDTVMNDSVLVKSTVPLKPDLTVVSADFQTVMMINQDYFISAVIANVGKALASNFTVKFNLGAELPFLVKNLDLDTGLCMTVNWTLRTSIAGSHLKLRVDVDATNVVAESNEFNNIYESDAVISVRTESLAFVELQSVNSNQKSFTVPVGGKATVKLTLTLQNKGEKSGRVVVIIREGPSVVVSDNVTVQANQTATVTYKWNITGAKTHTAKVEISGSDVGLVTSRVISVDLTEEVPGFELIAVAAAAIFVVLLVRKRRK